MFKKTYILLYNVSCTYLTWNLDNTLCTSQQEKKLLTEVKAIATSRQCDFGNWIRFHNHNGWVLQQIASAVQIAWIRLNNTFSCSWTVRKVRFRLLLYFWKLNGIFNTVNLNNNTLLENIINYCHSKEYFLNKMIHKSVNDSHTRPSN